MVAVKTKITWKFLTFTSEGSLDNLVTVLNNYHRDDDIYYIEPIIMKGANAEERYGYRVLIKRSDNANSIPAPK